MSGPLLEASSSGNADEVGRLLKDGLDPNNWEPRGRGPIHEAARNGHTHILEFLLEWKAQIDFQTGDTGLTALHISVAANHPNVVQFLVERKANVNIQDEDGFTSLHKAIQTNNRGLTEMLLDHGAKVDCRDKTGLTPLHVAAFRGLSPIVEVLLRCRAAHNSKDWIQQSTALHRAAREGHIDIVKLLFTAKDGDMIDGSPMNPCEIDCRDRNGWTPLHYACTNGHGHIVELLLEGRTSGNKAEQARGKTEGAWFETETDNDQIPYDPGGKTPLRLGTQAAAVQHVGPLKGSTGKVSAVKPVGDIEDLLRKWEYLLIDEDGDGDLTAEEMVAFVRETEKEKGARPFFNKIAEEEAAKRRNGRTECSSMRITSNSQADWANVTFGSDNMVPTMRSTAKPITPPRCSTRRA